MLQADKKIMPTSPKQSVISFSILILLFCIAAAVGIKQQYYEKAIFEDIILKDSLFSDKFTSASNIENYSPTNLYEKIDGKADLYLNNGFISLQCRRFSDNSATDKWVEVFLYDMANGENAFAVYSMQKRPESTALDWAQFGYSTSDALYVAAGQYYIEVALSSDDPVLLATASAAIKNLIPSLSAGKMEMPFFNLFPTENLTTDSFKFISADAFGSDLKNIFTAEYNINGNSVTVYLSKDSTGDVFKNYYRFLIDNGGTELKYDAKLPDCKAVELFGTTDIIFRTGNYFAGVRGSAPINDLKLIADKLIESLSVKNE